MGFLSAYSGTVILRLDDNPQGYWVELKRYLSQGEKEKADTALINGKLVPGSKGNQQFEMEPNIGKYRQLIVEASIVSWNLDDDNGHVWPVDLQHVRRLPAEVFDKIYLAIDGEDPEPTPEERRQFPDERVGGDPDGRGWPSIA